MGLPECPEDVPDPSSTPEATSSWRRATMISKLYFHGRFNTSRKDSEVCRDRRFYENLKEAQWMRPWCLSNHIWHYTVNLETQLWSDFLPGAQAFLVDSLWCLHTASQKLWLIWFFLGASVTELLRAFGPWLCPGSWVPIKSSLNICSECCICSFFLIAQRLCFTESFLPLPDPTHCILLGCRKLEI